MTLFWLMWVGLVLGALLACLWHQVAGHGNWFRRPVRAVVPKHDVRAQQANQQLDASARGGADFWPPPRVVTHAAPPASRSD